MHRLVSQTEARATRNRARARRQRARERVGRRGRYRLAPAGWLGVHHLRTEGRQTEVAVRLALGIVIRAPLARPIVRMRLLVTNPFRHGYRLRWVGDWRRGECPSAAPSRLST
ncbi:hypothetical protein A176_003819 [Myxococcus hansupus]|uniref:Uncharacterized protein n=1 Tax=Pseudomyxococcus hansupus TaxID=1297742 RepID=A0A0H4XFE0_9BACT|nr:hypothetical protein A176_003819 [Myxococcus hansupus]